MLLHKCAAGFAGLLLGLIPRRIVTFRIAVAAEECAPAAALSLDDPPAALRTQNPRVTQKRFCITALRETGTGKKFAKTSLLDHHHAAALIARNIGDLLGELHRADGILRFFQRLFEWCIKAAEQLILVK